MIAAAPSEASAPTPNVAAAAPGTRSDGAGRPWMKTAVPSRSHPAPKTPKQGPRSDAPALFWASSQPALAELGQLGGGQLRVLQRDRPQPVEGGRVGGDQAGDVLVGDPAQITA